MNVSPPESSGRRSQPVRVPRLAWGLVALTLLVALRPGLRGAAGPTSVGEVGRQDVRLNEFLSYSPPERVVRLRVVAGFSAANDAMNFNGAARGSRTIVVPSGWRVDLDFENAGELPHSALVFKRTDAFPEVATAAVFPGARTRNTDVGIERYARDRASFVAASAGEYALVCGVSHHANQGMWLRFTVSAAGDRPEYRQ